jgi:hypothetical protein
MVGSYQYMFVEYRLTLRHTDHSHHSRIAWTSRILPLTKFSEICQRVYFAVSDYSDVDLILTNGFLSEIFAENGIVSGRQDHRDYSQICRKNLFDALLRLPLLLPPSMEAIASVTIGVCIYVFVCNRKSRFVLSRLCQAFNAIENGKAAMAWSFISTASMLCKSLGYHRLQNSSRLDSSQKIAQRRLFWIVYGLDKGLSLRLGRMSNLNDADITTPVDPDEPTRIAVGRIQGKAYDQLYSPIGLSRSNEERSHLAMTLAEELRRLIKETHGEISVRLTCASILGN